MAELNCSEGDTTIKEAIQFTRQAWACIPPHILRRGWTKAAILPQSVGSGFSEDSSHRSQERVMEDLHEALKSLGLY